LGAIETKRGVGLFGFGGELESARWMSSVIDDTRGLFCVCFSPGPLPLPLPLPRRGRRQRNKLRVAI
jgi:hypothetical protein